MSDEWPGWIWTGVQTFGPSGRDTAYTTLGSTLHCPNWIHLIHLIHKVLDTNQLVSFSMHLTSSQSLFTYSWKTYTSSQTSLQSLYKMQNYLRARPLAPHNEAVHYTTTSSCCCRRICTQFTSCWGTLFSGPNHFVFGSNANYDR